MLVKFKGETNKINLHQQEPSVNDNNNFKELCTLPDKYNAKPAVSNDERARDIIRDIINDIIGPPVVQPTPKVKCRPSSK